VGRPEVLHYISSFQHGYEDYQGEYEETKVNGSIRGAVYKNQIFVKITVKKEGERCSTQLDSVQVTAVKYVHALNFIEFYNNVDCFPPCKPRGGCLGFPRNSSLISLKEYLYEVGISRFPTETTPTMLFLSRFLNCELVSLFLICLRNLPQLCN
jgi:hypothetical protein